MTIQRRKWKNLPQLTGDTDKDLKALINYIDDYQRNVQIYLDSLAAGHKDLLHSPPARPQEGQIVYADGVTWNPGSGKGLYQFRGTIWVFVG